MLKKLLLTLVFMGISSLTYAHRIVYAPRPSKGFIPAAYIGVQGGYGETNWKNLENATGAIDYSVSGANAPAGRLSIGYDWRPHLAIEG